MYTEANKLYVHGCRGGTCIAYAIPYTGGSASGTRKKISTKCDVLDSPLSNGATNAYQRHRAFDIAIKYANVTTTLVAAGILDTTPVSSNFAVAVQTFSANTWSTSRIAGADAIATTELPLQEHLAATLSRHRDGPLTARELEVLLLVSRGQSNKSIADELVVSEHTVHRHVSNILAKLGQSSRAGAASHAISTGMLEP